jgi:hypothetical protein
MGRRLLPRPYSHGLREHIHGNGFLSDAKFPVTAKTMHVLQESILRLRAASEDIVFVPAGGASMQEDSGRAASEWADIFSAENQGVL